MKRKHLLPSGLTDRAQWTYGHAQLTRSSARKVCEALCDIVDIDPTLNILAGPTKTPGRMVEKAIVDYGGDFNQVRDPCRFMILFDDPDTIARVRKDVVPGKNATAFERFLGERNRFSYSRDPKDMFDTPKQWGYMGFMFNFEPANPQKYVPFEIQMTHRDLHERIYPLTHDLYESVRPEIEEYEQEGIPFGQWDRGVQLTVMEIWSLHNEAANEIGIMPYVGQWPQIDNRALASPKEDDIAPVDYQPLEDEQRKPGYGADNFEM